jgi:hypothetical protein
MREICTEYSKPLFIGTICDENGFDIPPGTPPPPRPADVPPDQSGAWAPYKDQNEFEIAEFLFKTSQMRKSHVNVLMRLLRAWNLKHGVESTPFDNNDHLESVIDSTPVGGIPWKKFTMSYNGERPLHDSPSWMDKTYEVYYRDPRQLAHEIIGNSDFDGEFDYAAYQEFGATGKRRFGDFMSANFAWRVSVSS